MRLSEAKYHELKALAEAWDASVNEYARMILMKYAFSEPGPGDPRQAIQRNIDEELRNT